MSRDVVFTVQTGRTVSAETWSQFVARAQAEGRTPRDVLRDFIERYARGETS
jgi:hypothetical protein